VGAVPLEDKAVNHEDAIYAAVFGYAYARQHMDHMAEGHGCPDDECVDRFAEEADAIAEIAVTAWKRVDGAFNLKSNGI